MNEAWPNISSINTKGMYFLYKGPVPGPMIQVQRLDTDLSIRLDNYMAQVSTPSGPVWRGPWTPLNSPHYHSLYSWWPMFGRVYRGVSFQVADRTHRKSVSVKAYASDSNWAEFKNHFNDTHWLKPQMAHFKEFFSDLHKTFSYQGHKSRPPAQPDPARSSAFCHLI